MLVSQSVSATLGIPTISPSATSPQLTDVEDNGYFFRTALSDAAQGPVLAQVTRGRGFDNVGLIYQDDAYGKGLAAAFEESWNGKLRAVSVDTAQTSYLSELAQSADAGAQALVVIAFEGQALSIVREAIDEGIYSRFVFGDAAKRVSLVREIGGEKLGGMNGTAGGPLPATPQQPTGRPPSSPCTANCRYSPMSKRPTMRPSPSLLQLRLQVVPTALQSAIVCGKSQDHPAGPS